MNWISVAERLPQYSERVLLSKRINYGTSKERVYIGARISTDIQGECYALEGRDISYQSDLVTRWMPLPEPPEEEV